MAMAAYGVSILPLLILIKSDDEVLKHLAYADDVGGGSRLGNGGTELSSLVRK